MDDPDFLSIFWDLAKGSDIQRAVTRLKAVLSKTQSSTRPTSFGEISPDTEYAITRLVKGLTTSRTSGRLGFMVGLISVLKHTSDVNLSGIWQLFAEMDRASSTPIDYHCGGLCLIDCLSRVGIDKALGKVTSAFAADSFNHFRSLREAAAAHLTEHRSSDVKEIDDINYLKLSNAVTSHKTLKKHLKTVLNGSYYVLPRLHSFWATLEITSEVWAILLSKKLMDRKKHICLLMLLAEKTLAAGKLSLLMKEEFMSIWWFNLGNKKFREHARARALFETVKKMELDPEEVQHCMELAAKIDSPMSQRITDVLLYKLDETALTRFIPTINKPHTLLQILKRVTNDDTAASIAKQVISQGGSAKKLVKQVHKRGESYAEAILASIQNTGDSGTSKDYKKWIAAIKKAKKLSDKQKSVLTKLIIAEVICETEQLADLGKIIKKISAKSGLDTDSLCEHLSQLLQLPEAMLREIACKAFAQFVNQISEEFMESTAESITGGLISIPKLESEPTGAETSLFGEDVELANDEDFESILLSEPAKMKADNSGLTFAQRLCDFAEVIIQKSDQEAHVIATAEMGIRCLSTPLHDKAIAMLRQFNKRKIFSKSLLDSMLRLSAHFQALKPCILAQVKCAPEEVKESTIDFLILKGIKNSKCLQALGEFLMIDGRIPTLLEALKSAGDFSKLQILDLLRFVGKHGGIPEEFQSRTIRRVSQGLSEIEKVKKGNQNKVLRGYLSVLTHLPESDKLANIVETVEGMNRPVLNDLIGKIKLKFN